eukprot:359526-Chlamydomonas_euryale.AAC.1
MDGGRFALWIMLELSKRLSQTPPPPPSTLKSSANEALTGRGWGADGPGRGRGRVALSATIARRPHDGSRFRRRSRDGRATRASDRWQGARDLLATRLG